MPLLLFGVNNFGQLIGGAIERETPTFKVYHPLGRKAPERGCAALQKATGQPMGQ